MSRVTCGACRFFEPGRQECRRRAPTTYMPESFIDKDGRLVERYRPMFPRTLPYEWCGEYERGEVPMP